MEEIFDIMNYLENDLADFYEKINRMSRYKEIDIFSIMKKESQGHGKAVKMKANEIEKPTLNREAIWELQKNIKEMLFNQIVKEDDEYKVFNTMANTEETIGRLYQSTSQYAKKMSDYYLMIAEEVNKIATEEFQHKKLLLDTYDINIKKKLGNIELDKEIQQSRKEIQSINKNT